MIMNTTLIHMGLALSGGVMTYLLLLGADAVRAHRRD